MNHSNSVFIKRFRMKIELDGIAKWLDEARPASAEPVAAELASAEPTSAESPVQWLPWNHRLSGHHAHAKWESFRNEMDASVFACLADREGCRQLMRDLSHRADFVPEATWLAIGKNEAGLDTPLATIQGLRSGPVQGSIQNIGVVPNWRGRGLGNELIRRCLAGFRDTGCRNVTLEVTTHNLAAIRLYESVGFRSVQTVFKYCYLY
jgi:ribosomal protein S18 acetylase RimI-like enzyme